jgi:hypothetical protein
MSTIKLKAIAMMIMLAACQALSAPIIGYVDDWQSGAEGWSISHVYGGIGNIADPASVGGQSALGITADTAGNFVPLEDKIFNATTLAGGLNYSTGGGGLGIQSIQFSFYSDAGRDNNLPAALELYFMSGGAIWRYNILPSLGSGGGWSSVFANINSPSWFSYTRDAGDFAFDLTSVDEIGAIITYQPNLNGQVYGIDNFSLNDIPVPEPEEYAMLAMLAISLAYVFRNKLNSQLGTLLEFARK